MDNVISLKSKVRIVDTGTDCIIHDENRRKIENEWRTLTKQNPGLYNGPVYSVVQMDEKSDSITLICTRSDYAHYKYSEKYDLKKDSCKNVYGSCLVVTFDGYAAVALNGKGSEFEGKIQVIGGGIEPTDKIDQTNFLDPEKTAMRELREEAGKEIQKSIGKIYPGYLLTDGKKFGVISIGISSMTMTEMESAFMKFKRECQNDEIKKLIFFHKDNQDELEQYLNRQDLGVVNMIKEYFKRPFPVPSA